MTTHTSPNLIKRMRRRLYMFLAVAVSCITFSTAQAAADMFLDIPGVPGESNDVAHIDEIDVLAWSWGASTTGRKNCIQDLGLTKWVDRASARLLMGQITREVFPEMTLTVRQAGGSAGGSTLEYLVIKLYNAQVSSLATGGSGGEDRLTENVSFSFGSGKFKYTPQLENGAAGASVEADIPMNNC